MKKHERRLKKRKKAYALFLKRLKERKVFNRVAQRMSEKFNAVAKYMSTENPLKNFLRKHKAERASYGRVYTQPIGGNK